MPSLLTEKVAIVTGAGRGVGAAIAHALAAAGARVAVNDINPDRAESVAAAIQADTGEAIGVAADVSNKFQCVHLIETTRAQWGRLDILVNCAHIHPTSTILKTDEFEWQRCLDVNLKGTFFMSQLVGRVMADENKERGGEIVNVAATAGHLVPMENRAAYSASMAGVIGFTRTCAREYAAYNVRVNAVLRAGETAVPPPTIAAAVLFLCTDPGRHLTGAVIPVPHHPLTTVNQT